MYRHCPSVRNHELLSWIGAGSLALPLIAVPCAAADTVWQGGVVAADHSLGSEAGLRMLELGGNAVDAAVAASFCLSVVRPYSCGIGGGGFMIIHLKGEKGRPPRSITINYREMAPSSVGPDHFEKLDDPLAGRFSGHAVAVPGTVAGLLHALEKYGTLDRGKVLAPAIEAAERGLEADDHYMTSAGEMLEWFEEDPSRRERFSFVWERFLKGGSVRKGDRIRLPEQAEALRLIRDDGPEALYSGPIGQAIVEKVQEQGGTMSLEDLRDFQVDETTPLLGHFKGKTLLTMPPPSSGGVTHQQILRILEIHERDLAGLGHNSADYIHLVTEAMKHAFADRAEWLGDADFVDVLLDRLLSDEYIEERAARFDPNRTLPPCEYGTRAPSPDDHGTSHISVIDADGNAVACTETINLLFGSRITVDRYGFALNNEMDDFLTRRGTVNAFGLQQSTRNLPAPGKRPLSSMSPTIMLNGGEVELVAGASGGPRIISSTLQVILNVILFDMQAEQAVSEPRFHHQWVPDELKLEPGLRSRDRQESLLGRGHILKPIEVIGAVQLVRSYGSGYQAASDPRKGGIPAGRLPR